jgi:aspartyl-tRNA synthetase
MVEGFEKYFQIARCFRDEDNRADRQPEFTQIDIEMSFPTEEDVYSVVEPMLSSAFEAAGIRCEPPFPRLTHAEAMELYGTDRPDLRFGAPLSDLSSAAAGSGFAPFDGALSSGGTVRGLRVPGGASLSRKQLDALGEEAKRLGAPALLWVKRSDGEVSSPAKKHLDPAALERILAAGGVEDGDLLLIVAGVRRSALNALGALRLRLARDLGWIDETQYRFCWVTDFPLFERDDQGGRWFATHHPFTAPKDEDLPRLETDSGAVRARAYDVVLNGTELGGGSIRIHRADVQQRVFQVLGIREDEARDKFGFLLDALRFGAPPHGGIAFGLDRICMLAAGGSSIRDVIAFPKTASGLDLMARAPSTVADDQLRELGLVPPKPADIASE